MVLKEAYKQMKDAQRCAFLKKYKFNLPINKLRV